MKKVSLSTLGILTFACLLTAATLLFNRQSSFEGCEVSGLHQVKKGLPFPIILVRPSVSLCNSVEPISILWKGNAYHEQYPLGLAADIVFWSVLSASALVGFKELKKGK